MNPFIRKSGLSNNVASIPISCFAPAYTRPLGNRSVASVIPGDSVLESTVIGGTATFFDIYQNVIGTCWFSVVQQNKWLPETVRKRNFETPFGY